MMDVRDAFHNYRHGLTSLTEDSPDIDSYVRQVAASLSDEAAVSVDVFGSGSWPIIFCA